MRLCGPVAIVENSDGKVTILARLTSHSFWLLYKKRISKLFTGLAIPDKVPIPKTNIGKPLNKKKQI